MRKLLASLNGAAVVLSPSTKGMYCCLSLWKNVFHFWFKLSSKNQLVMARFGGSSDHKWRTTFQPRSRCWSWKHEWPKKQTNKQRNSGVFRGNVLEAFALPHQCPLQDDTAFLVALALLCGKLIHPAQFAVAVLAADVPHHVSSREHDSVLDFTLLQIHNLQQSPAVTLQQLLFVFAHPSYDFFFF